MKDERKNMKVKIFTLGCKVNQFESVAMINMLEQVGYTAVSENESSDVTIVNSCAVTAASEQKAVKLLNRIRREDPDTVILLTGCMAQTENEDSVKLKEADIVLGNKRRNDIVPPSLIGFPISHLGSSPRTPITLISLLLSG